MGLGNELLALFHSIAHHFQHFHQHCQTVQLEGKALDPSSPICSTQTEFIIIISVAQLDNTAYSQMENQLESF